jgi:D-cysteine desulfhydrase
MRHAHCLQSESIGERPTPLFKTEALGNEQVELWIKHDGLLHQEYGGNKVRKLELIIADAKTRNSRRLVTVGAAGSHQALATALFGARAGLRTAAILFPQPWHEHCEQTLRAALGLGLEAIPTRSLASVPFKLATVLGQRDYFVPIGGSGPIGTIGYARAVDELLAQLRNANLDAPDVIVAALGSGGTVAGILAGIVHHQLQTRVIGVDVAGLQRLAHPFIVALAERALALEGKRGSLVKLSRRLSIDRTKLGNGYAHRTPEADRAEAVAPSLELVLDPVYTAKAFATVLELIDRKAVRERFGLGRLDRPLRVLYWHTLSAAPLAPLLRPAPPKLPAYLKDLFVRPSVETGANGMRTGS